MNTHQIDTQNMKKAIYDFPDHLEKALNIGKQFQPKNVFNNIQNIVVTGMGGSAIGGDICHTLLSDELKVPLIVNRNYSLPHWVNEHTLVICSSYSGNTEETLAAYEDAKAKDAQICGISTGGELTEKLRTDQYDFITTPAGLQPRAALAFSVVPMLYLLNSQGLIGDSIFDDISDTIDLLCIQRDEYAEDDESNPTHSLAMSVYQSLPIIYGTSGSTSVVALRWKGQFSENAEMMAYYNELPEMNHNEIVGWENNTEIIEKMSVLWLKDLDENERIQLRQKITRGIIADKNVNQHIISVSGSSARIRLLHLIHFGDWVSYWCAIHHNTDPTPVKPIMHLKEELSSKLNKGIELG